MIARGGPASRTGNKLGFGDRLGGTVHEARNLLLHLGNILGKLDGWATIG